jgi:pimeloyl-ACP methyl ester carboxylesterase
MGQTTSELGVAEMKKVYIIHGWTYSLDKWTKLVDLLRQHDIQPELLRVPGLTEPSDKVWDIDGYIDWLNGKLKGETHPIVIGHSNGGRIALSYAQKYPDRLGQLILIDSAGLAHNDLLPRAKLATLRTMSKVGKPLAKVPIVKKGVYKIIGAQDYRKAPPNMKLTMQNMLKADSLIDLSKIKLPVTLIWGRDDTTTPLKDGQTMHTLLAGSSLHIIDDARHAPQATHAQQLAAIIMKAIQP